MRIEVRYASSYRVLLLVCGGWRHQNKSNQQDRHEGGNKSPYTWTDVRHFLFLVFSLSTVSLLSQKHFSTLNLLYFFVLLVLWVLSACFLLLFSFRLNSTGFDNISSTRALLCQTVATVPADMI